MRLSRPALALMLALRVAPVCASSSKAPKDVVWTQAMCRSFYLRTTQDFAIWDFKFTNDVVVNPKGSQTNGLGNRYYDDIYLTPANLAEVRQLAYYLAQGENLTPIEEQLTTALRAGKNVPVSQFMPENSRALQNAEGAADERNCWNACLTWHDSRIVVQNTTDVEMEEQLKTNYRNLNQIENPQFGDLIVFRVKGDLVHSAIFINSHVVWHKPGIGRDQKYGFQSMADVLELYVVGEKEPSYEFFRYRRERGAQVDK